MQNFCQPLFVEHVSTTLHNSISNFNSNQSVNFLHRYKLSSIIKLSTLDKNTKKRVNKSVYFLHLKYLMVIKVSTFNTI